MKKILICPLNWGLGHATRCIPVARELQRQGFLVDFASDGGPLDLLRLEFPESQFFELPGYRISYPTNNILINVGRHLGTIVSAIRHEHRIVREITNRHEYDILISDNRYGCYANQTHNIFICHQVNILSPVGALNPAVNAFHHRLIRKFDQCWIPDFPESPGLSGQLGHDHTLPRYRYIGPISRMSRYECPAKYRVTAVLSGPEPQRSHLETKLRGQMSSLPFATAIISGVVSSATPVHEGQMVHFPFLTSAQLNDVLMESEIIICRGGYSSLMDLIALQKKAICIPTPGQTEQEYLTRIHAQNGYLLRQEQDAMQLSSALDQIDECSGFPMKPQPALLQEAIQEIYSL